MRMAGRGKDGTRNEITKVHNDYAADTYETSVLVNEETDPAVRVAERPKQKT